MRRKSKTPLAKAKAKLWKLCRQLTQIRDGTRCITCGAIDLKGHHLHCGHFIPSSCCGAYLRYDIRNLAVQCSTCNIYRSGAGAEYLRALENKYSKEFVDRIIADKSKVIKADVHYINSLIEEYTTYLDMSQDELIELTRNYKLEHER